MSYSVAPKWAFLAYALFFLVTFSGCKKKTDELVVNPEVVLTITSFVLEKKNNPHLSADIVFDISGTNLVGKLKQYRYEGIPTIATNAQSLEIDGQKQISATTKVDFRKEIVYTLIAPNGAKKTYTVNINWDNALPKLDIATSGNAPINSVEDYVPATISIDGLGVFDSYTGSAQIRGRGNTTWRLPKKPYKIKLDQKSALFGLPAEKDWVLLANYLDGTHLLNAVAMKTGELLKMPFTVKFQPVEVYLNGQYQGVYLLTEQIEVKNNRVNIGDDGILLQLEQYFDEDWRFKSDEYGLPVMVMHPELTNAAELEPIKMQFEEMEALVSRSDFPNNYYVDFIDVESVANYFLANMLTDNRELNHPKSTFMYKTRAGKWTMGPIWDFDWAYGYEGTKKHFSNYDKSLLWSPPSSGTRFFSRLMTAPAVKSQMKQKWADFKAQKLPELLAFVDDYAFIIEGARARDYQKWKQGNADFKNDVVTLKLWLQNRVGYMDGFISLL